MKRKFEVGDKLHFTGTVMGGSEDSFVTVKYINDTHYFLDDDGTIREVPIKSVESSHILLH